MLCLSAAADRATVFNLNIAPLCDPIRVGDHGAAFEYHSSISRKHNQSYERSEWLPLKISGCVLPP